MKTLKNRKALERQAQLKHNPCYDVHGECNALLFLALLVVGFIAILAKYAF